MVFVDSSEISLSIRNAVRHLQQLGKYDYHIKKIISLNQTGESFRTNTFTDDDLNNIDHVADTLMALVNEISFFRSFDYMCFFFQGKRNFEIICRL
jgi:hypothetical protein